MPSWIGPWEIAIVVVLALLIFGPRKLPDLGASLGKSIRGFKKGLRETEDEVKDAVADVREPAGRPEAEPTQMPAVEAPQTTPVATAPVATAPEVEIRSEAEAGSIGASSTSVVEPTRPVATEAPGPVATGDEIDQTAPGGTNRVV
ncbi:MAG: twin-arginine translocase TatA/TatE family subunit [Thermoleophilia bacterium]